MGKREFRGDRLLKITRLVVNIVAGFTLFFGILGVFRLDSSRSQYMDSFDKCTKDGGTMLTCGFYLDQMKEDEEFIYLFLKIGIGLPVLFYSGTVLYNYLFPKRYEEKK